MAESDPSGSAAIEKRCAGCGDVKSAVEFARDKWKATGLRSYCKACDRGRARHWYERNREARLAKLEQERRAAGVRPRGGAGPRFYKPRLERD